MRARRHVPSTTDATGDGLLHEVAPTMAFATGVFEVDTMANVELDYSIDQERAICPHGLFYLKYGFFSFLPGARPVSDLVGHRRQRN